MIIPFDCEEMYYDTSMGRYVLNIEAVNKNLFLDENLLNYFKGLFNNKQFLMEISEDVYRLILSYKMIPERMIFKHYVNTQENLRNAIKRAMLYHVRYALRSGGNLLKDMHGVDIERGRRIDVGNLRGSIGFSDATIEELKSTGILTVESVRYLRDELDFTQGWF